jgi:predicted PurR-regulated permease PerM
MLVVLASLGVFLMTLQAARQIVSPVILALVLAVSVTPIINWFMGKGLSGGWAFGLALLIIYTLMLGLIWLISLAIQDFSVSFQIYEAKVEQILMGASEMLSNFGIDINELIIGERIIAPHQAVTLAAEFANDLVAGLSNWGLILITAAIFLLEATKMPKKLRHIVEESGPQVQSIIRINQDIRFFMSLSAGLGVVAAILDVILLLVLGVEFPLLWGVFAFLMGFIPNIGIFLALIPPAFMAYIQFGLPQMIAVVVGFLLINQLINRSIKTRYIQKRLNLSGPVLFLSLILWSWIFGPIGAIVAVPLALLIQAILASRTETSWIAYLMGDGQDTFDPEAKIDRVQKEASM